MGCSASKLDDGEVIQLCKDRKNFIKQAVEQRLRFATGHTAYVDSLRRVSVALRNYMEGGGGESHDLYSDSCSTPPFTPPVKRYSPEIMRIPPKPSSSPRPIQYRTHQTTVHYLRSGGGNSTPAVTIEESPVRMVNSSAYYYPASTTECYFGIPSSSASPPLPPPSNENYYSLPPSASPQNSQWDFFWNPFSSLDNYGYSHSMEVDGHGDHMTGDDDMAGLRRVREEEGIPDLEDEYEEEQRQQDQLQWRQQQEQQQQFKQQQQWRQQQEQQQQQWKQQEQQQLQHQQWQQQQLEQKQKQWQWHQQQQQQQQKLNLQEATKSTRDPAGISNTEGQMKKFQSHEAEIIEPIKNKRDFEIDLRRDKELARNNNGGDHREATAVEETNSSTTNTPGFTVYINRRPGSMSEIMRDIETQFVRICDSSQEISIMLEASRAHYTSTASNELTGRPYQNNPSSMYLLSVIQYLTY